MVSGPDFVARQVRDLSISRRFHEEAVGLAVDPDGPPNAVVFRTAPIPFAVREPTVDLDAVDGLGWGVALWFKCDDLDALHIRLSERGTPIVQPPTEGPFGR